MDSTFFFNLSCPHSDSRSVLFSYQFLIDLEPVEAQSIDTDNSTLADKRRRVNLIYQAEYRLRLTLTGQHKEHVHLLATIASMTVHHRTASVGSCIDGGTQFQILVRDDEELHRSAKCVHHMVYTN